MQLLYNDVAPAIFAAAPFSLGFPGEVSQSMYYPSSFKPTREEISIVSKELERRLIHPENTRIQRSIIDGNIIYDVLIASTEGNQDPLEFTLPDLQAVA